MSRYTDVYVLKTQSNQGAFERLGATGGGVSAAAASKDIRRSEGETNLSISGRSRRRTTSPQALSSTVCSSFANSKQYVFRLFLNGAIRKYKFIFLSSWLFQSPGAKAGRFNIILVLLIPQPKRPSSLCSLEEAPTKKQLE